MAGQALNGRHGQVDTEAAIGALHRSTADDNTYMDAEDDKALRAMLLQRTQHVAARPLLLRTHPPSRHTPSRAGVPVLRCLCTLHAITCSHKASS